MVDKFDLKLITEFDSSTSVVDWIERVELTCCLCGVKLVIPLWLMGGALDIYQQLSDNEKANVGLTKAALYKEPLWLTLIQHSNALLPGHLMADKTMDVVFGALEKLAVLFWRITWTDLWIRICGWIHGSGETTIEGVDKHWSDPDWAITWACTGHCQGWSRTGGAGCNGHRTPFPKLDLRVRVNCFVMN